MRYCGCLVTFNFWFWLFFPFEWLIILVFQTHTHMWSMRAKVTLTFAPQTTKTINNEEKKKSKYSHNMYFWFIIPLFMCCLFYYIFFSLLLLFSIRPKYWVSKDIYYFVFRALYRNLGTITMKCVYFFFSSLVVYF